MKLLWIALLTFTSLTATAGKIYETRCKAHDCFTKGWVTTSEDYVLDTRCKARDCREHGWSSVAKDKSTYDVTCRAGGCFTDGWTSTQNIEGQNLYDDVLCNLGSCLKYGWNVRTGYDLSGGNVTCNLGDCSRYGGQAFWRGRTSRTVCYENDCYKKGWTLFVD